MKLYHGSNIPVEVPEKLEVNRRLDFEIGFYLTSSLEQAARWAELTTVRRQEGHPTVTGYEFDEGILDSLNVLRFDAADRHWLEFIAANRNGTYGENSWDIVIGPVANDRTMPVIRLFLAQVYTVSETLRRLLPQKLQDQYAFKTVRALGALSMVEVIS